jgi:cystine transport system substrate-binding protein
MKKLLSLFFAAAVAAVMLSAAGSAAEKSSLDKIKESGTLKIGTEGTYPPYTYHDKSNKLVGYDVEVGEAIAKELGVKAEFVEAEWDSLIIGLDSRLYNTVINQVGINDDRKAKYDFSIPYTYTRAAVIAQADNDSITTFTDLKGKKAAQTVTSNYAKLAERNGAVLVGTQGFSESIELVLSGRADVTINDDLTFYDYLKQHPNAKVKIAVTEDNASENAVIFAKGQPELQKAIDDALTKLRGNGTLKKISEKYFGADISVPGK